MPDTYRHPGTMMGRPDPSFAQQDQAWGTGRSEIGYNSTRGDYQGAPYRSSEYDRPRVTQLPPVRELFAAHSDPPPTYSRPAYSSAWAAESTLDRRPSPHHGSLPDDRSRNYPYPGSHTASPATYPVDIHRDPSRSGPNLAYETASTPRVLQPPPYATTQTSAPLPHTTLPTTEHSRIHYGQDHLTSLSLSKQHDYRDYPPPSPGPHSPNSAHTPRRTGLNGQPLPKFVGEVDVPGEGICYLYDDGSHCKKFINGEKVNEQWGVTKAGKPRKRLAVACLNCREKKIKCEPAEPKCAQCEKSGKECIMNTPRAAHHVTPDTPEFRVYDRKPVDAVERPRIRSSEERKPQLPYDPKRRRSSHTSEEEASSPRVGRSEGLKAEKHTGKKTRRESSGSSVARISADRTRSRSKSDSTRVPLTTLINGGHQPDLAGLALRVDREDRSKDPFDGTRDPYVVDPELTTEMVNLYLKFVNDPIYGLFPTRSFQRWVKESRDKTTDEIMVLYMVMAMGSLFSPNRKRPTMNHILHSARDMVQAQHGNFNLQIMQTRLLLSVYYFAIGKKSKAWEWTGQAVRALFALNFHTEEGIADLDPRSDLVYGLNKDARFSESCSNRPSIINDDDIFLRVPCSETTFDEQRNVVGPFFENTEMDKDSDNEDRETSIGQMGLQVQITRLLGGIARTSYRFKHKPPGSYNMHYEKFYRERQQQLTEWYTGIPQDFKCTPENVEKHAQAGTLNKFACVNALYRYSILKLNRHARQCLPRSSLERNIRALREEALSTLVDIGKPLEEVCKRHRKTLSDFGISIPIFGYCTSIAAEILSAGGTNLPETLDLIGACMMVLEEQSQHWASSKGQLAMVTKIVKGLAEQATPEKEVFRVLVPPEEGESTESDIILATPEDIYLETITAA